MDIIPAIGSRPLGDVKGTDPAARTKTVPRMGRKGQGGLSGMLGAAVVAVFTVMGHALLWGQKEHL